MIKAIVGKGFRLPTHLQRFHFGGGHAHKAFDWRDDHALNPYYEADPRTKGIPNPYEYAQPFESGPDYYAKPFPDSYNPKDLTQNYTGTYPPE